MVRLWKDYAPVIVLVPTIIGFHYGWFLLQQNEKLVPKEKQTTEQPIVAVSESNHFVPCHLNCVHRIQNFSNIFVHFQGIKTVLQKI